MAHVPMDDIQQLWNEAPHDWDSLEKNLESRQGKANGINNNLIQPMMQVAKSMEQSGQPYPHSPMQLYNLMNKNLPSSEK